MTGQSLTCEEVRDLAAAYVLDALDAAEAAAVRAHLAACDDPHPEIADLGSVVSVLPLAVDRPEPPPQLRDRILRAASADHEARTGAPIVAGGVVPELPLDRGPVADPGDADEAEQHGPGGGGRAGPGRDERAGRGVAGWMLRAAAVLAIVALAGWAAVVQVRLAASDAHARDVEAVLAAAAQPGAVAAVLAPESGGAAGPRGLAAIAADGTVTLAVGDLPATFGDQVYEAWLISGDSAPIALGGFRVGDGGTGRLDGRGPAPAAGDVVALTLEPGPGATAPSLPIVVSGTAAAPPAT